MALIYFVCLGFYVLAVWKMDQIKNKTVAISIVLLGIAGLGMLTKTVAYGGRLVYQYGVGVTKADSFSTLSNTGIGEINSSIIYLEDGSWVWDAGNDLSNSWVSELEWLERPDDINTYIESNTDGGPYRVITANDTAMFCVVGKELESVQIDLSVDLTDFNGDFRVVHHVNNRRNYDYFSISKGVAEIGRVEQLKQTRWGKKDAYSDGLVAIRVVGMNRHYRGYINDKLVLHNHADNLPPGKVGLFIQGQGTVRIKSMGVQVLVKDHSG